MNAFRSTRSLTAGFTLVEVMIVIVILGILTTMALPSLQDRVIRAQISEGIGLAKFVQEDVQSFYRTYGRMPENNADCGLPDPELIVGNYVTSLEVDEGVIHVSFGNKINAHAKGKTVSLRPAIVLEAPVVPIAWIPGYSSTPEKMKVIGKNRTDLLVRHLPYEARNLKEIPQPATEDESASN